MGIQVTAAAVHETDRMKATCIRVKSMELRRSYNPQLCIEQLSCINYMVKGTMLSYFLPTSHSNLLGGYSTQPAVLICNCRLFSWPFPPQHHQHPPHFTFETRTDCRKSSRNTYNPTLCLTPGKGAKEVAV